MANAALCREYLRDSVAGHRDTVAILERTVATLNTCSDNLTRATEDLRWCLDTLREKRPNGCVCEPGHGRE